MAACATLSYVPIKTEPSEEPFHFDFRFFDIPKIELASQDTSESTEETVVDNNDKDGDGTCTLLRMLAEGKDAREIAGWTPGPNDPYFAYLIRAPKSDKKQQTENLPGNDSKPSMIARLRKQRCGARTLSKWQTHIGKGRNPPRKTGQHNRGELDSKSTHQGAPDWELVGFVGPFEKKWHAMHFRRVWRRERRTLDRRFNYLVAGKHKKYMAFGKSVQFHLNPALIS